MTDDIYAEYAAKGWPSINPNDRDYCYQPCRTGVHVCGEHPDGINCMSVLNLPTRTGAAATELFERAKAELAMPDKEKGDFVVDLIIGDEVEQDFWMNRQMLDRLKAMANPS